MEVYISAGIALVVLFIFINMFSLSLKLLWNGLCGVVLLWLFNMLGGIFGVAIPVNFISCVVAGFFGIPGVIFLLIYQLLGLGSSGTVL